MAKKKKDFQENAPKNQMLIFRLVQTSHFGLWDIIPPESQLAFHIYYVKYENTLTCKRITWDSGGGGGGRNGDYFSPKIKPYIYGNRKSNAKS